MATLVACWVLVGTPATSNERLACAGGSYESHVLPGSHTTEKQPATTEDAKDLDHIRMVGMP